MFSQRKAGVKFHPLDFSSRILIEFSSAGLEAIAGCPQRPQLEFLQMEPSDIDLFDAKFALQLLLEVAQEKSLDKLLRRLVDRILEAPAVTRVYLWLIEKGDICATCPRRPGCPDQTRCLHLDAGGRRLASLSGDAGVEYFQESRRIERIPLGVGVTGKVVSIGRQVVLNNLDKDPGELASLEWLKAEKIRGFHGVPIIYEHEVVGIFTTFNRFNIPDEAKIWADVFTNHIGSVIANVRAFEEIQRLKAQLEIQNAYLQEEVVEAKAFGELVGQSQALRHIVSQIDLVAPTEASVLILGESGTGKELVAREIHQRSRRKDKPLVRVNCASIPKDLFESEFFGHARGAFTGAIKDRAGRFEAAEGGTLFLDEIGEVPLDLQSKLLRVLQEKRYERVGEDRTRLADVRVIAATNRELKQDAEAGRFRVDLYYRLNVFPVQVAPLRERREDIPLLAQHFVKLSVKEMGCAKPRLTRAGIIQLQGYDWPGNIRELRNVIERAVILASGGTLAFDLPAAQAQPSALPSGLRTVNAAGTEFLTETQMRQYERENLAMVLEKTRWKIKGADGAAELLGINPGTLLSRIRKWGLKRPA
jgi:transcriptional regulator with GAF, ATPase, and Fis domain